MFLTRFNRPLLAAVAEQQDPLPGLDHPDQPDSAGSDVEGPEDDATCDNGACWT
ncbi:MAG: hypothetical protein ACRDRK_08005 [Pseudonocardia sp.]